jgi:hypothetical protein
MAELAKHIIVGRDEQGAPRITIDGQVMPWFTNGIAVDPPSLDGMTALKLTIVAERITLDDRKPCSMDDILIYEDTDSVRSPGWYIACCNAWNCGWETSGSEPVCEEAADEHVRRSQNPETRD